MTAEGVCVFAMQHNKHASESAVSMAGVPTPRVTCTTLSALTLANNVRLHKPYRGEARQRYV